MSFYDRLMTETTNERQAFQQIGLITHVTQNGVSKELYAAYLAEAYHHVRFTVPLLEFARDTCKPADSAYISALAEYIDEEQGHEEWILNDINALGFDGEAVRAGTGSYACRMMVSHAYYTIEHVSPYAFLGMVHVLEGMSVALADVAAKSIASSFGDNPPNAFTYLTSHGGLDIEHVAFFKNTVNAINDAHKEHLIIDAAKDFYRAFGDIFRDLEKGLSA